MKKTRDKLLYPTKAEVARTKEAMIRLQAEHIKQRKKNVLPDMFWIPGMGMFRFDGPQIESWEDFDCLIEQLCAEQNGWA